MYVAEKSGKLKMLGQASQLDECDKIEEAYKSEESDCDHGIFVPHSACLSPANFVVVHG